MDKLVRKIEIPLAKKAIEKAGLYIVEEKDLDRLAEVAADAYRDYPLHNWFTRGKYDPKASKLIMQISLKTMTEDAVIYADSEEMKSSYGISPEGERFTVTYTAEDKEKTYTVYIGHKFEAAPEESETTGAEDTAEKKETHRYFYTFEGSTVVYSADGDTVDDIFTYLSYTPKTDETTGG